jgi:Protein of unknown function (DUF3307)
MTPAATFAVVFAALGAGHWIGDYWIQTHHQALAKGGSGWAGRRACAAHVATYTLTLAGCLALAAWRLSVPLNAVYVATGLAVSAVTHYAADRRRPLQRLAEMLGTSVVPGKAQYWRAGDGLATGAAYLDQAWHWTWLFASALVIAGGWPS